MGEAAAAAAEAEAEGASAGEWASAREAEAVAGEVAAARSRRVALRGVGLAGEVVDEATRHLTIEAVDADRPGR